MAGRKKIWLVVITLLVFVGVSVLAYKLCKDSNEVDKTMKSIEYSRSLNFEVIDHPIFIKTRMWGLLGGHSCIFITENNSNIPNEKMDIIFDLSEIYYKKVNPDSLIIFVPSMSYSEEEIVIKNVGKIKVKIYKFKASQNKKYEANYSDMGLSKVTTNTGFE